MNIIKLATAITAGVICCTWDLPSAQADPMISDYTYGKAMKELKCGKRSAAELQQWFNAVGVTQQYMANAQNSPEFWKGYMYGSPDC